MRRNDNYYIYTILLKNLITIIFSLFYLQSFCQEDSLILNVGDQRGVTLYKIEYAQPGKVYKVIDSFQVDQSATFYKVALKQVIIGYYRIHAIGVNQYSSIKHIFGTRAQSYVGKTFILKN